MQSKCTDTIKCRNRCTAYFSKIHFSLNRPHLCSFNIRDTQVMTQADFLSKKKSKKPPKNNK